nr:BBF_HP1_G0030750.mRNA.1.CDS.1 [Saccharomyces cerevisiae]
MFEIPICFHKGTHFTRVRSPNFGFVGNDSPSWVFPTAIATAAPSNTKKSSGVLCVLLLLRQLDSYSSYTLEIPPLQPISMVQQVICGVIHVIPVAEGTMSFATSI